MFEGMRNKAFAAGVAAAITASVCGGGVWADQQLNPGQPAAVAAAAAATTTADSSSLATSTTSLTASSTSTTQSAIAVATTASRAAKHANIGSSPKVRAALDLLVQNGTINQTQENAVIGAIQNATKGAVKPAAHQIEAAEVSAIVQTLHLTPKQFKQDIKQGQTVAQIAQAQSVPLASVSDAATNAVKQALDAQVKAGTLTAIQETKLLSTFEQRLPSRLTTAHAAKGAHATKHAASSSTSAATTTTSAQQ